MMKLKCNLMVEVELGKAEVSEHAEPHQHRGKHSRHVLTS